MKILRDRTILSILIIVPLGFYSKFYKGALANWVNNSVSGIFYEIFWCLLIFLFLRKTKTWKIAFSVLLLTCLLEFLQLWHHPFLEFIRNFFIGRTLLGNCFSWSDFPYYILGCAIGWLWMHCLKESQVDRCQENI
ncbi:MAG: DUF2809 domain-containing protein [bacterium]